MNIIDKITNSVLLNKAVRHVVDTYFLVNQIRINKEVVNKAELLERIIEFEVVKRGEVDYISLNSLFDYYEADFDQDKMKVLIDSTHNNYIRQKLESKKKIKR